MNLAQAVTQNQVIKPAVNKSMAKLGTPTWDGVKRDVSAPGSGQHTSMLIKGPDTCCGYGYMYQWIYLDLVDALTRLTYFSKKFAEFREANLTKQYGTEIVPVNPGVNKEKHPGHWFSQNAPAPLFYGDCQPKYYQYLMHVGRLGDKTNRLYPKFMPVAISGTEAQMVKFESTVKDLGIGEVKRVVFQNFRYGKPHDISLGVWEWNGEVPDLAKYGYIDDVVFEKGDWTNGHTVHGFGRV